MYIELILVTVTFLIHFAYIFIGELDIRDLILYLAENWSNIFK